MGKVDDMRRQRELLFAQAERERAARASQASKAPRNAPAAEAPPAGDNGDEQDDESDKSTAPASKTKLGKKVAVKPAAGRASKIAARTKPDAPGEPEEKDTVEPEEKPAGKATAKSAGKLSAKAGKNDEVGVCSVCRKSKPVRSGLVSNHMKGLGKACSGSRKPPA